MSDFNFKQKPNRLKHLCCPEKPEKWLIYNPLLLTKFPCRIKMTRQIQASPGSNNHNQCYTVANQTLNAYGKWAGCPGGSGPGYSSTMRYVPNENGSGLGPNIGGSICNCNFNQIPIPAPPPTVLLIDTNNYVELIYTSIYYLAQGNTPYVMPFGSYMTSFTLYINGTNVVINFQNVIGTNLFTWSDNQTRVSSTATTVNLATAVNITGCSQFTFSNLINASASYPGSGIANIGIRIYGYII